MLGIVAVTLFADLLIMRVLDDIRDSDYDRIADPQRPVASGAVAHRHLSTLCALCVTVIVVANLSFPRGLFVLVVQLIYTGVLMAVGQRFPATRGDNLVLNLLVSFRFNYCCMCTCSQPSPRSAPMLRPQSLGAGNSDPDTVRRPGRVREEACPPTRARRTKLRQFDWLSCNVAAYDRHRAARLRAVRHRCACFAALEGIRRVACDRCCRIRHQVPQP